LSWQKKIKQHLASRDNVLIPESTIYEDIKNYKLTKKERE